MKTDRIKLAVIGRGCVTWMRTLMRDVYLMDEISGGEIHLIDPKVDHAQAVADMLHTYNKLRGKDYKINVSADKRDEALDGADFVMTTFSPGSMDAFWNDLEIPIKYGIRLPVSMTVGISGISAAIRTVPVAYQIVEEMEQRCPGAWMLNVTNPMSCVTSAMNKAAKTVKIAGMCHEFHGFETYIGPILGLKRPDGMNILDYLYRWLPEQGFDCTVAGLNHFIWLTKANLNGKDVLPEIRAFCEKNDSFKSVGQQVKILLCRQFGYLPIPGDRHLIEFYPSLCNLSNGFGMKHGVVKTTVEARRLAIINGLESTRRIAGGAETVGWNRSGEEMIEIMRAIITGNSVPAIINAPNTGQIENMPKGVIVETLSTIDRNGIKPKMSGSLPGAVGSLCRLHADIQEMTVKAALTGDRRLLVEAMSLDPQGGSAIDFADIPKLVEDLINANRQWLPRFF